MLELADRLEREMPRVNMKVSIHITSDCDTVCCIAGWFSLWNPNGFGSPMAIAQKSLGLSQKDADELFYLGNWPDELNRQYYLNDDLPSDLRNENQVRLMAERIRRMVKEDVAKVCV